MNEPGQLEAIRSGCVTTRRPSTVVAATDGPPDSPSPSNTYGRSGTRVGVWRQPNLDRDRRDRTILPKPGKARVIDHLNPQTMDFDVSGGRGQK